MMPRLWAKVGHDQRLTMRVASDDTISAVELHLRPDEPTEGRFFFGWSVVVSQVVGSPLWSAVITVVNQRTPDMGREMHTEVAAGSTYELALFAALRKCAWRREICDALDLKLDKESS